MTDAVLTHPKADSSAKLVQQPATDVAVPRPYYSSSFPVNEAQLLGLDVEARL